MNPAKPDFGILALFIVSFELLAPSGPNLQLQPQSQNPRPINGQKHAFQNYNTCALRLQNCVTSFAPTASRNSAEKLRAPPDVSMSEVDNMRNLIVELLLVAETLTGTLQVFSFGLQAPWAPGDLNSHLNGNFRRQDKPCTHMKKTSSLWVLGP